MKERLIWLPIYVISCAVGAAFVVAGVTYWNVEAGLYAGAVGAVFGALGWLIMGIRIPSPYVSLAEAYRKQLAQLSIACNLGLGWKRQAQGARALLHRARPYVGNAPFEGSLTLEQDIEAFLYREEEEKDD